VRARVAAGLSLSQLPALRCCVVDRPPPQQRDASPYAHKEVEAHSKITMTLQLKKSDLKFETVLQEANRFRGKGEPSGTLDHTPVRVVLFCRTHWALLHLWAPVSELPTSL
jgi:hypothetical protein